MIIVRRIMHNLRPNVVNLLGKVNSHFFECYPPGTLLATKYDTGFIGLEVHPEGTSWNNGMGGDECPLYQQIDFNAFIEAGSTTKDVWEAKIAQFMNNQKTGDVLLLDDDEKFFPVVNETAVALKELTHAIQDLTQWIKHN